METHLNFLSPLEGGRSARNPCDERETQSTKKLRLLRKNLCPIPFISIKTLDHSKHKTQFKTLRLWDFAHLQFNQCIRSDLLGSLIANYNSIACCSYINNLRINLDLTFIDPTLKLPVKKGAPAIELPDFNRGHLSEGLVTVISKFMSNYMLLHEDTWMIPEKILPSEWLVKEGQPQKVDWAGLIWFIMEKELLQYPNSGSCYYASQLQCLMKW
ncbi:hypothetical protein AAC387_Pa01g2611 [Persea americana]